MHIKYFILLLLSFISVSNSFGQDNIQINYLDENSFPEFLNICGDADDAVVEITINEDIASENTLIPFTLHMFPGILFDGININSTSPSISLVDNNPQNPTFLIDVALIETLTYELSYNLRADCIILDTLEQNNTLQLYNTLDFSYDLNGNHLQEIDANSEYLDALAIPFFSFSESVINDPVKVGDCKDREITITNSGLDGFVDSLTYEIIQGAGESFQGATINGTPLNFLSEALPNGDTSILIQLNGTQFVNALNGDGDTSFDPDESIVLVETICIVNCISNHAAQHFVRWGCDGNLCSANSYESFTTIGAGDPHASIEVNPYDTDVLVGYCQEGLSTMSIRNTGFELDEGFGVMYDVSVNIGLGTFLDLSEGAFTITSIRIGSVLISNPTSLINLDGHLQFTSDPDGPGGLEDFDNDGYYDDLNIDASFDVVITYAYDCSMSSSLEDNCTNDLSVSMNAIIFYSNSCNDRLNRSQNDYLHPSNTSSAVQNFSDTDAFKEGDVFYITHKEERNVRNFAVNCSDQQYMEVTVELPNGISLESTESHLIKNINGSLPLLNSTLVGNIATLTFDISQNSFINGNYELILGFTADCTAELGQTSFPTTFSFVCPSCDCHHTWYCDDLVGPVLHGNNPPCNEAQSNVCPIGVRTTSFDAERITFGYSDNNYSVPFDENIANKKAAISCDLLKVSINSVVGDMDLMDSIGFDINYSNIDGTMDPTEILDFRSANVSFELSSGTVDYTIQSSDFNVLATNGSKHLSFDLSNAIADLGISLNAGTIINFEGVFALNPDGPYLAKFRRIPNFRGNSYAIVDGEKIICDDFGDSFSISKVSTVFSLPSNSKHPKGCEKAELDYRLNTINNGYSTIFGNEKRQAMFLDSIVLDYDPNFLDAFDSIKVWASLPGHPIYGGDFYEIASLDINDNGHYKAYFDTLSRFPSLDEVNSYAFVLRVEATPKCNSLTGSSDMDNGFNMSPSIYFKDRYYAHDIEDGSCVDEVQEIKSASVFYSKQPEFSFTALSNPTFELVGDTAVWIVKHCNTSFESSAPIAWLSLENMDAQVNIESIEDISDINNIIDLDITSFGTTGNNVFAFGNGLLEASSLNDAQDICNTYRVKATLNSCNNTSLVARVGWNCSAYSDTWTPLDNPPCEDDLISLSVVPKSPFLDANVVGQPQIEDGICDTIIIDVLVKNTDLAAAFDVGATLFIPELGTDFLTDDISISYPAGNTFVNIQPNVTFDGVELQGKKYTLDNLFLISPLNNDGLDPFNLSNPNLDNQFVLRYKFLTDCDFVGGSLSYYDIQGMKGCSELTNVASGETAPLFINPVSSVLNSYFISVDGNSVINPMGVSTIQFNINNSGSTTSVIDDKLTISLPSNVTYVPNSVIGQANVGWVPGEPIISVDGDFTTLTWMLPSGITPNEIASIQLDINTPDVGCDITNLNLKASISSNTEVLCIVDNSNCIIESNISTNNPIMTIPVMNIDMQITSSNTSSTCNNDGTETVSFDLNILNQTGQPINQDINYHYYFDSNGDGLISGDDVLLASNIINVSVNNNEHFNIQDEIIINANQVCQLLLLIDNDGLTTCDEIILEVEAPIIDNLMSEIISCSSDGAQQDINIDATCGQGYSYLWSAIAPADINAIADINAPNTTISITNTNTTTDTLIFILNTTRVNCATTSQDTLKIIRSGGVTFTLGPDATILPGNSLTLTPMNVMGAGPYTYAWSPTGQFDDPTEMNQLIMPTMDQMYSLTMTNEEGCSYSDSIMVTIGDVIVANVTPANSNICVGESLDLMASGGDNYVWEEALTNPTNGNLSNYNQAQTTFTDVGIFGTYNYIVIVSNNQFPSFTDTAEVQIIINPLPVLSITSSSSSLVCANEEVTLTGSGATSYQWLDQNNVVIGDQDILTIVPTDNQLVNLVGINEFMCSDTLPYTFLVEDAITWTQGVQNIEHCSGDTVTINLAISTAIGMVDIQPSASVSNIQVVDSTLSFQVVYNEPDTIFNVVLFDAANNCSVEDSFTFGMCTVQCEYFEGNETYNLYSDDCDSLTTICLSIDTLNIANYVVSELDGQAINNALTPCGIDGQLGINLLPGAYTIIISDTVSFCQDTAIVIIDCPISVPPINCDTVYINQDTVTYCVEGIDMNGPIIGVDILCTSDIGVNYDIDTLTGCVNYTSTQLGMDTSCISFMYENGLTDTLFVCLTTVQTNTEWIYDTIFINESVTYCLDSNELAGNVTLFENFCPELSGEYVDFNLETDSLCVTYTGLDIETDTACVVICDPMLHCDTTYFSVTVLEFVDDPMANDDYDTVRIGGTVTTNIKANDDLTGGIDTAYILNPPTYGTVVLNLDCSATYNASDEFCEREDTYDYVICNATGLCDTATVHIWIECDDIVIFTAVSPNGDGYNDVFYIAGLDDYPLNRLSVYNQWGNLVYVKDGYNNTWTGTWKDKLLPDGPYYYCLELNEDNRVYTGFIEIAR